MFVLLATPAFSQVQVDARLDKARYFAGEPIIVTVNVTNVGDEAVRYSTCDGDVTLRIVGASPRVPPNIHGCFAGMARGTGGCGIDHPPLLPPGQHRPFRYLLHDYDLTPGTYRLVVSGKA